MNYDGDIVYDTSKPDGQPRRCLDTQLAREVLGFQAQTSLREGLQHTINWFLANEDRLNATPNGESPSDIMAQTPRTLNPKDAISEDRI
jgi:dTDP-D-glucose 4,6-dehydratase